MFSVSLQIVRHVWRSFHVLTCRPEIQEALSSSRIANEFVYHICTHRWMAQDEVMLGGAVDLCIAKTGGTKEQIEYALYVERDKCIFFLYRIFIAHQSTRFHLHVMDSVRL